MLAGAACGAASAEAPRAPMDPAADAGRAEATPTTAPTTTPASPDADVPVEDLLRAIRVLAPNERAVPRALVDAILQDRSGARSALMKSARLVPEDQVTGPSDGGAAGIRLFGVRPDGVLARLGFENGDRVERVLGKPFTSPDHALDLHTALRGANVIDLDVTRRGTPMRLVFRLEP